MVSYNLGKINIVVKLISSNSLSKIISVIVNSSNTGGGGGGVWVKFNF